MPVEIKELQIVTVVKDSPGSAGSKGGASSSNSDPEAIIAACVEQIMDILQQKNER